ncbi:MAG: PilZ domain-containing protein [Candidatus Omnitrophota bacterium]
MKLKLPERRQFVRVPVPIDITIEDEGQKWTASTKNVSAIGLGIETPREIRSGSVKVVLHIPGETGGIRLEGRVVWQKRVSLEDSAPYSAGIEIISVEEEKKNVFLKFLCDLLYGSAYESRT